MVRSARTLLCGYASPCIINQVWFIDRSSSCVLLTRRDLVCGRGSLSFDNVRSSRVSMWQSISTYHLLF